MSTSHLDRVLHCLCASSKERGLFRIITRDASIDLLGELNIGPIWHDLVAGVDELLKLSLNCCHYLRMAMTNVIYRHTAIEIDIALALDIRSEEHTSEIQSLMRISYAVFCLKKKKI